MDASELGGQWPMLCRFLLFLLRNRDDAEEIAQETFRVALSKGPNPEKGTDYGAWLRSIARNLARNHLRRHRGRPRLLHADILELAERHFVETDSERDDVWETRRQALRSCMEKLSESNRGLLRRRYELGEKVKQIAKGLGMAPNSLSKRLERIRHRLGQCIRAALEAQSGE